jgi:hypothetical protein
VLVNASKAVLQPHLLLLLLLCSQTISNLFTLALRLSANKLAAAAAAAAELHQLLKAMPSSSNGCKGQGAIFKPGRPLAPAGKRNEKKRMSAISKSISSTGFR